MLVPAQLYKDEIKRELIARWYDPKYTHYFTGGREEVEIGNNQLWRRDFAYLDDDNKLAGYFSYRFNDGDKSMGSFGLIGFKANNLPFVREVVAHCLNMFTTGQVQRAEIWAIADNKVCKLYRRFANQYGGKEMAQLHRTTFYDGKYHDSVVWEFLAENVLAKLYNQAITFGNISDYTTIAD